MAAELKRTLAKGAPYQTSTGRSKAKDREFLAMPNRVAEAEKKRTPEHMQENIDPKKHDDPNLFCPGGSVRPSNHTGPSSKQG